MLVRPSSRIGSLATTPIRIGSKLYIADIEPLSLPGFNERWGGWPSRVMPSCSQVRCSAQECYIPRLLLPLPGGCYRWHYSADYLEITVSGKVTVSYRPYHPRKRNHLSLKSQGAGFSLFDAEVS